TTRRGLLGNRHERVENVPDPAPSLVLPHVPGVSWRPQPARAATRRPGRSSDGRGGPRSGAAGAPGACWTATSPPEDPRPRRGIDRLTQAFRLAGRAELGDVPLEGHAGGPVEDRVGL